MLKRLRKIRLKYSFTNRADFDLTKVRVGSRAEVILQQHGERPLIRVINSRNYGGRGWE